MATCPIIQATVNLSECQSDANSSSYRYRLPYDLVLDVNCGYVLSLLDISLSHEIINNLNCGITFRKVDTQESFTRALQPFCCTTGSDLVGTCNAVFAQPDVIEFCQSEGPPFTMEMVGKGNEANRVKITSNLGENNIHLEFIDFLSRKLGFRQELFDQFPIKSTMDPHVNYGNSYINVLFDCCQNRIFNSKMLPIVDTICLYESARKETAKERPYAISTRLNSYGHAYTHALTSSSLRYITITLLHEHLQNVIFCDPKNDILLTFSIQRHLFL